MAEQLEAKLREKLAPKVVVKPVAASAEDIEA